MAQIIINAPVSISFLTFPCEYRLLTAQCADTNNVENVKFSSRWKPMSESIKLDPWIIRDEFMAIKTVTGLTDFLNKTGSFDRYFSGFSGLSRWQLLFAKMLKLNPQRWSQLGELYGVGRVRTVLRVGQFHTRFIWADGKPSCSIHTGTTIQAIVATMQLDHLRGAKFRFCARPDCGRPYEVTSKHQRLYCSQYCAHFTSLRKLRDKKRAARNVAGSSA